MGETHASIRLTQDTAGITEHDHKNLRDALDVSAHRGFRTRITTAGGKVLGYIVPADQGRFLEQFEDGQAVPVQLDLTPAAAGPDWCEGWQEVTAAEPKINMAALSVLLARLIELGGISPRVLRIPDGQDSLAERIDRMLRDG